MIYAHIFRQKLTMPPETVVADTYGYLEFQFSFRTDDWQGLEKWAHFTKEGDDAVYDIRLTDDRIRREDHLDLTAGKWRMYLHGNRIENGQVTERITTNVITLTAEPTGVLEGEPFVSLTPGLGEVIMARMDEMDGMYADLTAAVDEANDAAEEAGISADVADIDAENAKKAAESAKTSAESAETAAKSAAATLTAIRTLPTLTLTGTDESGAEHTWIVFGEVQP